MKEITFKLPGMNKPQEFVIYPLAKDATEAIIQSDKRIARINLETGKGVLSKSKVNNGFMHLNKMFGAYDIELTKDQLMELKLTAIGNGETLELAGKCVTADNSGIANIKF